MGFIADITKSLTDKLGLTEKGVPANDRQKHRAEDNKARKVAEVPATFYTPLGDMTPAQYAAYVKSLTPEPFLHGYRVLDCGHKFTKKVLPRTNCTLCWSMYYAENPAIVVGMKSYIDDGKEAELVHHFGVRSVKKAKRFIKANPHLWAPVEAA